MIKVIEVENKRDLIKFIEMPYKIYKEYNFIPLLKRMEMENLDPNGKSPAFKKMDLKYFIAYKNNEPAGRIIAYTAM
ncbi:MAG: GTP cyclohydrolase, partial [candidate division WOR-3 bacterium]